MHYTKAWVAVNIATLLFLHRECSNTKDSNKIFSDFCGKVRYEGNKGFSCLPLDFQLTRHWCVQTLGKGLCKDVTTAGKSKGSHCLNLLLKEKKDSVDCWYSPKGVNFKDKQNQIEVLSNTAYTINAIIMFLTWTRDTRAFACRTLLFPEI